MHQVPVQSGTADSVTSTSSSPEDKISTPPKRVIAENPQYGIRICGEWLGPFPYNRTYLAQTDVVTLYRDVPPFR